MMVRHINRQEQEVAVNALEGYRGGYLKLWSDDKKGEHIRWISGWKYNSQSGLVVLTFSGQILFELSGFVDDFTKYQIIHASGLKSSHSIRLYQLSAQFKDTSWHYIKLEDLRDMFNLGGYYNRWIDLRKRVIDKAVEEITAKTDLNVSYQIVKIGRKVSAIRLLVAKKDQLELSFD